MPTGGKLWRYDYRFDGKRKTAALASFPDVSLKEAAEKQAVKASALTFSGVAQEWLEIKKEEWAASNLKKKEWLLGLLYKGIGNKPISEIVPADILAVIRPVEADGHNVTVLQHANLSKQQGRCAGMPGHVAMPCSIRQTG